MATISMRYSIFITLMVVLLWAAPAKAEPKLTVSPELSGMQNVMKVIRHVSLRQADLKSRQPMLDIMDIKGQPEVIKANPQPARASVLSAPSKSRGRKVPTIRTPK